MVRKRDSQRSKLYRWENEAFTGKYGEVLSLEECRVLAHEAIARYGFTRQPVIKDGRGHRNATGSIHEIVLPKWARNKLVVLHEAAHAIVSLLKERHNVPAGTWASHGPEFARVLTSLLDAYKVSAKTPGISAQSLARKAGVKVAPPGGLVPMPATSFKRWLAARAEIDALDVRRRALDAERTALKDSYLQSAKAARGEAQRATAAKRARGKALAAARGGFPAAADVGRPTADFGHALGARLSSMFSDPTENY
jgi:hypothetical protein